MGKGVSGWVGEWDGHRLGCRDGQAQPAHSRVDDDGAVSTSKMSSIATRRPMSAREDSAKARRSVGVSSERAATTGGVALRTNGNG